MLLAIRQIYIKQVNLAITCNNFPISINQHGGVVKLSGESRVALDNATTVHNHLMLACLLLQEFNYGSRDGLRGFIKTGIGPEIRPEFGEADELRAHVSSLIQKSLYICQILSRIIT